MFFDRSRLPSNFEAFRSEVSARLQPIQTLNCSRARKKNHKSPSSPIVLRMCQTTTTLTTSTSTSTFDDKSLAVVIAVSFRVSVVRTERCDDAPENVTHAKHLCCVFVFDFVCVCVDCICAHVSCAMCDVCLRVCVFVCLCRRNWVTDTRRTRKTACARRNRATAYRNVNNDQHARISGAAPARSKIDVYAFNVEYACVRDDNREIGCREFSNRTIEISFSVYDRSECSTLRRLMIIRFEWAADITRDVIRFALVCRICVIAIEIGGNGYYERFAPVFRIHGIENGVGGKSKFEFEM